MINIPKNNPTMSKGWMYFFLWTYIIFGVINIAQHKWGWAIFMAVGAAIELTLIQHYYGDEDTTREREL